MPGTVWQLCERSANARAFAKVRKNMDLRQNDVDATLAGGLEVLRSAWESATRVVPHSRVGRAPSIGAGAGSCFLRESTRYAR